jgi:hypothetical protein
MSAEGPQLRAAKRLLDLAKRQGFAFHRLAPGEDGPLFARRETLEYRDELYLGGFSPRSPCRAARSGLKIVAPAPPAPGVSIFGSVSMPPGGGAAPG